MQADSGAVSAEIRLILKLVQRRERERTGLYLIEGVRQVFEALRTEQPIRRLLYCERLAPAFVQKRVRAAKRDGMDVLRLSPAQFREISRAEHASGVAAVVDQKWLPIEWAPADLGLCWVAMAGLRNPGNLGTIIRTAEACGAAGVMVLGNEADPYDPSAVRASMGGLFGLSLVRTTTVGLARWAQWHGARIVGTSPSGCEEYTEIRLDRPVVLLLGEERKGLTDRELGLCQQTVRIPILGLGDSLNVAVAAAVVLYDVLRRKRFA